MNTNTENNTIQEITLKNFLSFGPETKPLKLQPLNVLIGPNGSGKSNFIEAISLLRSMPKDFSRAISEGGGVNEYIWKGDIDSESTIDLLILRGKRRIVHHTISFQENIVQQLGVWGENISEIYTEGTEKQIEVYKNNHGFAILYNKGEERSLTSKDLDFNQSILSQIRDPFTYPVINYLAGKYGKMQLYRKWLTGKDSILRSPQKADIRNDNLEEDFSNWGLFLSKLFKNPTVKRTIIKYLNAIYEGLNDIHIYTEGGTVQVFLLEENFSIPAVRLSDGTLHYLCLLAILCDPEPPPLICIEEPELGLHPNVLPTIADLLVQASERTQLIVTTHSDILVDALSNHPEYIIVCEKHNGQTEMNRLEPEKLKLWLEKYTLGQLWIKGELGGVR